MRILGIDPGVATVGFGVIEAQAGRQQMIQYGAITTPAGQPLAARLVQIAQDMETLITQFQPDEMSMKNCLLTGPYRPRPAGSACCIPAGPSTAPWRPSEPPPA